MTQVAQYTTPTGTVTRGLSHGDTIKSFRGVEYIFLRIERMPEAGRSGKVVVTQPDSDGELVFYDIVFPGLKLIEREV